MKLPKISGGGREGGLKTRETACHPQNSERAPDYAKKFVPPLV